MKSCLLVLILMNMIPNCMALLGLVTGNDMTCSIDVQKEKATVTIRLLENMNRKQYSLKKTSNSSDNTVPLLDFDWLNGKFRCVPSNGTSNCSASDDGQTVTADLKHVDGHNWKYELQAVLGAETVICTVSHRTIVIKGGNRVLSGEPPEGQDEDKGGGTTIIGGVIGALMAVVLVGLVIWKRDLLLAACDKKKSASLKEQDAEEMLLQVLATKEKTLDEKPQAAVTDGGDKSTSETPAVTVHPTDGSDIPVHCGQGEGGCRRAEEAQNPEKDPILHSSPSASLSTGSQPGNHLNQPSVEEDGSETGDQPRAGHVRAVCAVFEGLKDSSDDKCRKNTCRVQSGTDLGITLYAFDVQASSAPPAPGKSVLTVRHTAVIHPEERSRSVAERTEPKLRFESNSGTGSCLF